MKTIYTHLFSPQYQKAILKTKSAWLLKIGGFEAGMKCYAAFSFWASLPSHSLPFAAVLFKKQSSLFLNVR